MLRDDPARSVVRVVNRTPIDRPRWPVARSTRRAGRRLRWSTSSGRSRAGPFERAAARLRPWELLTLRLADVLSA